MIFYLSELIQENLEHKDGVLYWKRTCGRKIKGNQAGWISKGYVMVGIGGEVHPAHRIIFLMHHGYCPEYIDHIDGNRSNNKIENLRPATLNENARNCKKPSHNTSGALVQLTQQVSKTPPIYFQHLVIIPLSTRL